MFQWQGDTSVFQICANVSLERVPALESPLNHREYSKKQIMGHFDHFVDSPPMVYTPRIQHAL